MRIKKGDTVYVLSGANRGKTGRVLNVNHEKQKVLVEGVNMRKKHQRPTQKNPKGGIITIEAPVHASNLALYSSSLGGPTRVSMRVIEEGGKKRKVRICRKTGEQV
ncbi:MAG: 50S ribosomal protein L24 [candidate division Zixibacteria bacterium]|nr:50S ribosomal protein L24 [candidate division Zixibacteria bacterium]MCK4606550.1 50S ribosomal protein L24 [candidate division Zixibacteria bacterium]